MNNIQSRRKSKLPPIDQKMAFLTNIINSNSPLRSKFLENSSRKSIHNTKFFQKILKNRLNKKTNKQQQIAKFVLGKLPTLSKNMNNKENKFHLEFLEEIKFVENEYRDEDGEAEQLYIKLSIEEFVNLFFYLLSLGCAIVNYELKTWVTRTTDNISILNNAMNASLILCSIASIFSIFASIHRYLVHIQLMKVNKVFVEEDNFFSTDKYKDWIIECILTLIHPNYFFRGVVFTTNPSFYLIPTEIGYEVNDFLLIFMFLRIYTIFRFYLSTCKYYDPRSNRIGKMMGVQISRIFAIRCIFVSEPYLFLLITIFTTILGFAYIIRIIEGVLLKYQVNKGMDFSLFQNCVWWTVVTMTSVGYGDYTPLTLFGRIIAILATLTGTIIVSFMVVALGQIIKFNENQEKAYFEKESKTYFDKIEQISAEYLYYNYRYKSAKRKYLEERNNDQINESYIEKLFKQLKEKMIDKIKSRKRFKSIMHEYRNIFDPMCDMDIFLMRLEKVNSNLFDVRDREKTIEKLKKEIQSLIQKIKILCNNPNDEIVLEIVNRMEVDKDFKVIKGVKKIKHH